VPPGRAPQVAERLLASDVFSGWGLRTLSERHCAYDPFSYHRGSVWPHDTAIAVAGLRRYSHHAAADRLTSALLDAAERFPLARLPEAFSGLPRAGRSRPAPLRPTVQRQPPAWRSSPDQLPDRPVELLTDANGPQAWAASSVISVVTSRAARSAAGFVAGGPRRPER
jgi:glycogen debranching enzyme